MTYQIIRVTDKHIKNGRRQTDAFYKNPVFVEPPWKVCPIAQAVHEQTKFVNAVVDIDQIFSDHASRERMKAHFPRSVARFIRRFDRGEKVKVLRSP